MQDLSTQLATLTRPQLLVDAANAIRSHLTQEQILTRVKTSAKSHHSAAQVMALMGEERDLNYQRKTGQASYSPARHIDVLAALQTLAKQRYAIR